jgi:hypothetical protein
LARIRSLTTSSNLGGCGAVFAGSLLEYASFMGVPHKKMTVLRSMAFRLDAGDYTAYCLGLHGKSDA